MMLLSEWLQEPIGFWGPTYRAVGQLTERKQRLLACACCSSLRCPNIAEEIDEVVRGVYTYLESGLSKAAMTRRRKRLQAQQIPNVRAESIAQYHLTKTLIHTISFNTDTIPHLAMTLPSASTYLSIQDGVHVREAKIRFYPLYADIAGSVASFPGDWRTTTSVQLARGMYESQDFSAMPILGDALQDAGCDNDEVLNHCRDPQGIHVRGCWVVDLVLSKS